MFTTEIDGERYTLDTSDGYIARGPQGPVSLYNRTGAEILRDAFVSGSMTEARRAIRAARRAYPAPMRLAVYVFTEQGDLRGEDSEPMYSSDCEVYGWRAALTAVRAMRQEMPYGWRTHALVTDARLDALFSALRGES